MTPHHQLFRHDPENGVFGDCHRTAIACLLDMHPSEVPHFAEENLRAEALGNTDYDWTEHVAAWLAQLGLASVDVIYDATLENVLAAVAHRNPRAYYLLGGQSVRGTNHTVVGCGGEIAWDPHPDGGGLIGPLSHGYYEVTFIVPLSMQRGSE